MQQPNFWRTKTWQAYALWPLACVYSAVSRVNIWRRGLCAYQVPVPVVSVGNINVGGVGKTPVVAALAAHFAAQGELVAILSRGYGGKYKRPYKVTGADSATDVGDEPKMLFDQFKNQSIDIWVAPNRVASAKRAVASGATVLILDDGFQYVGLKRGVNLLVADGTYGGKLGTGNGMVLPAGPLREPLAALRRVDAFVIMNGDGAKEIPDVPQPQFEVRTVLAENVIQKLQAQQNKDGFHVLTAIGQPTKFTAMLAAAGLKVNKLFVHPDHHVFSIADLTAATEDKVLPVLTTAKDAVKIPTKWRRKFTTVGLEVDADAVAPLLNWVQNKVNNK